MSKPLVQLEEIGKSFGDLTLYENLNMTVNEGDRIALIAPNGAGKTTLLNIIAGKDTSDSGRVTFTNDIAVSFLEQVPELDPEATVLEAIYHSDSEVSQVIRRYEKAVMVDDRGEMEELLPVMDRLSAWDYETRAKSVLTKLKTTELDQQVKNLSGGLLKRVALANALIEDPDVLIMDEPTNHLGLDMVEWLEDFLIKRNKALLLVTHDRYFLDRICTAIYELDQKKMYRYDGGYSDYLIKREERIEHFHAEVDKAQNLYRRELEWMRRMPQARGTKAKYRKDAFYETKDKAFQKRKDEEVKIRVQGARLGTKIFEVKQVDKSFGDKVILKDFSYTFNRYEKMGIIGRNGTGKSTFLNIITGLISPDRGAVDIGETVRFGYYRQQGIEFDGNKKVIDVAREIAEVVTLGDGSTVTASQFLNLFLFPPETQYNYVSKLSGGEKRRLYLLSVLMRNPNFLILDEPTNDLDIMTLNVLEEYLVNFEGCIIIVSHDRYFMDKVAEHLLVFEGDGKLRDFPGNYTQYRNEIEEQEENRIKETKPKPDPNRSPSGERPRKMSFKEKQEFEGLEKEIEALEEEKKKIEDKLASGGFTNDELIEQSTRLGAIIDRIDTHSMRWLELSELQ